MNLLPALQATGLLSDATNRWLSGSEVTIETRTVRWQTAVRGPAVPRVYYRVRVVFPNGRKHETGFFERADRQGS